jgi:hypothetical protein
MSDNRNRFWGAGSVFPLAVSHSSPAAGQTDAGTVVNTVQQGAINTPFITISEPGTPTTAIDAGSVELSASASTAIGRNDITYQTYRGTIRVRF